MKYLVITNDYEAGKSFILSRFNRENVVLIMSSPYFQVKLDNDDVYMLTTISETNLIVSLCGVTVDEIHFLSDVTEDQINRCWYNIAPCMAHNAGKIYHGDQEVSL